MHQFVRGAGSALSMLGVLWALSACDPSPAAGRDDGGSLAPDAGGADASDASTGGDGDGDGGSGGDDAGSDGGDGGGDGGRVAAFVAQGHLGRTTVSCDLGRTWIGDRDEAPADTRCWQQPTGGTEVECDHQPNTARGIDFGREHFIANFGWGPAGNVRRSRNGIDWEVIESGNNYASTVDVNGRVMLASSTPTFTDDDGTTLHAASYIGGLGTVRRGGGGDVNGETFVISGDNGLAVNRDGGVMGWQTVSAPSACRAGLTSGGIEAGGGALVVAGAQGVCVSTDRGATWTMANAGGTVGSSLVWTGEAFVFIGQPTGGGAWSRFTSSDGQTWSHAPITVRRPLPDGGTSTGSGPVPGILAHGGGTFVAVNREWQQWYEKQMFFRSEDGVTWDALPPSAFVGSHPITHIAFGWAERSSVCP